MTIKKTIAISLELYEFLKIQGKKGESFDAVIRRLISPSQSRPDQSYTDQSSPRQSVPNQAKPIETNE